MSYNVQFVGLVCFLRENGGRHLLLPDGRNPGGDIDPHHALIAVARDEVVRASGWEDNDAAAGGTFVLPPCSVSIEGSDVPGQLDTREHDGLLPELRALDRNFEIVPERAETIATLHVRQGSLHAYTIPDGSAVISELRVPHDGPIRITVTPRDGSPERSVELKPGTEIAVANISTLPYLGSAEHNGHFRIYEKLSVNPVRLREPDSSPAVPESQTHHRLLTAPQPIGLTVSCSNTGCCTPTP